MALQKQPLAINFAKGVDTKTDPYQLNLDNFLSLQNTVFTSYKKLTKRNGFDKITTLPDDLQTTLTTLNDNLLATGSNLFSFNKESEVWIDKGIVQPVQLSTQPLVRVSTSQTGADTAVTSTGLVCLVYVDNGQGYYQISDSTTGEQLISRQTLPNGGSSPRVFILGNYFIILYISSGATLQYIAIPIANPTSVIGPANFSSAAGMTSTSSGFDGIVAANNTLYAAWEGNNGGVNTARLFSNLLISTPTTTPASTASLVSVTQDPLNPRIYVSFWSASSGNNGYTVIYDYSLLTIIPKHQIITNVPIAELTSIVSTSNLCTIYYQNINNYQAPYPGGPISGSPVRTDYISKITITVGGVVSSPTIVDRSVGIASKPFVDSANNQYLIAVYGDVHQVSPLDNSNQPTYFLINSVGDVLMPLAYANGGGYEVSQVLPSVSIANGTFYVPYLKNDFLTTVNKGTNLPTGTPSNAIYTQTGVNLAIFTINDTQQYSSEIAGALHLAGGQLWEYDGVRPVEHGFYLWPENVSFATSGSGGDITAQDYYYSFTYEWTDNQGNLHRSAPSIPLLVTTTGSTSTNTLYVPTLRLTKKVAPNPIRIVGYRWSTAQQVYYQFTSVTNPTLNDTTVDFVTITDTKSDLAILGQAILYTTGGVVENIVAPPSSASTLFKNRLFLVDAEDKNLLWYSKQVIENTPVEMSDLLTLYVAPTTGTQGSTGYVSALAAMDDKLIMFKSLDAIYYLTGTGPDNTGANNDFTDPTFITSSVGCTNPNSIVLIPDGLMFQSNKGIWLLGRDLQTSYIGAPVEIYNSQTVLSAKVIPGTNQARFVLDNSLTLVYDFFFQQWSVHTNVKAISGTLYESSFTYLNSLGQVLQETPGSYSDGSDPVLISLTTAWINLAGVQGFERFYFANLLGTYFTPFKLNVTLAYDYNSSAQHNVLVQPDNFSEPWGGEALWGSGPPWGGGPGNVFSARVFPNKQKCQSFQVSIQEIYDPTLGVSPGQGLSLSGLALVVGTKRGFRTQSARRSYG